ncbi:MAG TPA: metallopeptidase TldD-related protein, partial [Trueperaceae bacterium]
VMHEGDSLKQGFEFEAAKEFHSLDPGRTSQDMLEATGRLLGARPLATGRYTAYFEPKAFTDLLRILAFMLSGKNVSEGRSRLAGRLGQRVAAAGLTLVDDPLLETGLANRPFDSEGTPAHAVTLIEDGVLQSYLHNSQTARALGQPNTGHAVRHYRSTLEVGPSNLFVRPGRGVRPDNGVIVTGMMGLHAGANPISGDLSLQAFGLLVQDGEIAHPVENFALSGNLLEMLARITGLGDTLDWKMSGFAAGAPMIEIAEVSFAGA